MIQGYILILLWEKKMLQVGGDIESERTPQNLEVQWENKG